MVYSMYDRMIVGGAMPVHEELLLEAIDPLKAPHFTTRREIGIYNVGEGEGIVRVGEEDFELAFKGGSLYRQRRPRRFFKQGCQGSQVVFQQHHGAHVLSLPHR